MVKRVDQANQSQALNESAAETKRAIIAGLGQLVMSFESTFAQRWILDGVGNAADRLLTNTLAAHDEAEAQWLALTEARVVDGHTDRKQRDSEHPAEVESLQVEALGTKLALMRDTIETAETVIKIVTEALEAQYGRSFVPMSKRPARPARGQSRQAANWFKQAAKKA